MAFKLFTKRPHRPSVANIEAENLMFSEALDIHRNGNISLAKDKYQEILRINPNHQNSLHFMGVIAIQNNNPQLGVELISRSISICPSDLAAFYNRAAAYLSLKQYKAALQDYESILRSQPDSADAHYQRGAVYFEMKEYKSAFSDFNTTIQLNPEFDLVRGRHLHTAMHLCDWHNFDELLLSLINRIDGNHCPSTPFSLLAILDSAELQRTLTETYAKRYYPAKRTIAQNNSNDRLIRIGYFSSDYHDHATAHLISGLIENHDRTRFEVYAFSYGPDTRDYMRVRLENIFDDFIDIRNQSDAESAQLSRSIGIDIAIDLKGYTGESRPGIFADRAAPIQINYLGYPGTLGSEFIDYIIADNIVINSSNRAGFSESIIYLPNSYQPNDATRSISSATLSKSDFGIPDNKFIFCCFNCCYKFTPKLLDCWCDILHHIDNSVLWLLELSPIAKDNLLRETKNRGIDIRRLIFCQHLPHAEHLARHRLADLFLDTYPCNAHTAASDSLWAGLPLITLAGESFASRVASSLLNAVGLSELVVTTFEEYAQLAISLANDPNKLLSIRNWLQSDHANLPLFNTKLYTYNIESAFSQIYTRRLAGLSPADIYIEQT